MKKKIKVPIIVGPTSSGKTSLALDICKNVGSACIISADSRQIYKHMDIGTGKVPLNCDVTVSKHPEFWKVDSVDIWGYDLAEPDDFFSAVDFAEFALNKVREVQTSQKATLIVGGTGFYIDILTGRSTPSKVIPDLEYRNILENENISDLEKRLTSLNPYVAAKTDTKNKVRVIRAIEREVLQNKRTGPLPYLNNVDFVFYGLSASREYLYKKADQWLETVWKRGLLDEVSSLLKMGFGTSPKLHGLVYRSAIAHLQKEISQTDAIQRAKFDLHAYIRRQQTWFKKNEDIKWFDITKNDQKTLVSQVTDFCLS